MPRLGTRSPGRLVLLIHRITSLGPHWPHPASPPLSPEGKAGGAQGGSLAWHSVVAALRHRSVQAASSQAGGWLGTLSGLVDFCGKGQTCPLWRRFTNTGDLPPASALLFFCVCEPDIPNFRTRRLDTYSGTSPPLLKKKTTNTPNQSKPSHPPSQLGL